MLTDHLLYKAVKPDPSLADLVESFWLLSNVSDQEQAIVIVPDGRIDIFFSASTGLPYHALLRGLDTEPGPSTIPPKSTTFAVSLTLLAAEYVLNQSVAPLLNKGELLPADFWEITANDLTDFDAFCGKASAQISARQSRTIDDRKRNLVKLIYASHGSIPVSELAETVRWSSRQVNRYFTQWFGLPLKAYCNILRFSASISHLKEGKLFPEENFTDQAHFIHQVKKYTGVIPKTLSKNSDDRFIQFSLIPEP